MSAPVIPPSFFYWLSVCDGLSFVSAAAAVLSVLAAIGCGIAYFVEKDFADTFNDEKNARSAAALLRMLRILLFVIPCSVVCAVFIPSKQTLLSMTVAKFFTYENAQLTVDAIKEAVDYIVQTIAQLK